MFEAMEDGFAYTIRRHDRDGGASWHWEVRELTSGRLTQAGVSGRSHDAAKTAALEVIFHECRVRGDDALAP